MIIKLNGTEVSDQVFNISEIEYNINKDFSFELPVFEFESSVQIGFIGDLVDITDSDKTISFYITEIKETVKPHVFKYKADHVLMKLKDIKVTSIPEPVFWSYGCNFTDSFNDWCDINLSRSRLSFERYNYYPVPLDTGTPIYIRPSKKYYQALFLMQILIRKATGLSINNIDVSGIYSNESHYWFASDLWGTGYTFRKLLYKEIGVPIDNIKRLGTTYYNQYQVLPENNVEDWEKVGTCLDLLKALTSALMLTIDIFNSYKVQKMPSVIYNNNQILGKDTTRIQPFRKFGSSENVLERITNVFGTELAYYYNYNSGVYLYTWGNDNDQRKLEETKANIINNLIYSSNSIDISFPAHFRIYCIAIPTDIVESYLYNLRLGSNAPETYPPDSHPLHWVWCMIDGLKEYWGSFNAYDEIEVVNPIIQLSGFENSFDLKKSILKYKRYYNV